MPPTKRPADTPAPGDEAARRVSTSTPKSAEIAAKLAVAQAKIAALRGGAGLGAAAGPAANGNGNGIRPPGLPPQGTQAPPVLDIAAIQARIRAANAARAAAAGGTGANGAAQAADVRSGVARSDRQEFTLCSWRGRARRAMRLVLPTEEVLARRAPPQALHVTPTLIDKLGRTSPNLAVLEQMLDWAALVRQASLRASAAH
ncbi:hypothetical protein IE81DRAFT_183586 [Ceraceosorus guamensis]|uniref:Uncharacterized protein n=1 Tax=Ceraceosorus guamensis TaxID=1522189 RepID=A0A316VV69_9BASI|nr:hypothetical protein IE81DRAFT_183586 [Ceraceosorus guamensis]PWN41174.1 hypothetical protein IE81DRAFT_183586 [Ceraceosorus guamensis]